MKRLKPILILADLLFVAACASVKTFNMPRVEEQLSHAFASSEEINGKMQEDLTQKKNLIEVLRKSKSGTSSFRETEPKLKSELSNMETVLNSAAHHRKVMSEAKGNITALGYAKKKINGDEPEYTRVEEAVRDFEEAAGKFNIDAAEYSRESNSLADLVAEKKLYFNFDVVEFQKKVQKGANSAQENVKIMQREIERAEDIRGSFEQAEQRLPVEQALAQMTQISQDHVQKIKELNDLNTQMSGLAQGQAKIPSTSPSWSEVQRLVAESDRISLALNDLYKEFQIKVDRVRNLPKANP